MSQGNAQAVFEAHLAPILGPAYGTAYHLTHNRDDAEDLVQEAALQAFRAFHTFQQGTNFKAWFFRVMTNLFLNMKRKQKREPEVTDMEDAPDLYMYTQAHQAGLFARSADPAELVFAKLDTESVQSAITSLPEEYRVVSFLYFMEEFSYQEIADMVDCPVGTVRSRLHRGRKMLQKALWEVAVAQGILSAAERGGR